MLDLVLAHDLGRVAHLLHHEHRGIRVEGLVDGRHHTEIHQHFDDLGRLDRHALRELADGDGLANHDLAVHGSRGHFKAARRNGRCRPRARLYAALFLVARADIARDVQFLAPVTSLLVVDFLDDRFDQPRLHRLGRRATLLALAPLGLFARARLGEAPGLVLRFLAIEFLFGAPAIFHLEPLAFAPLVLQAIVFALLGFERLATLDVDLLLLVAHLLLEHIALDISALAAHLDVDRARTALNTRELQFALGFSLQSDLARRAAVLFAAVTAPQMGQKLELRIVADAIIRAADLDSGLIQLHEQPVHRHLQHFGKLRNGYFGHELKSSLPSLAARFEPGRARRHNKLAGLFGGQPFDVRKIID